MGSLEKVAQMKKVGMSEGEIIAKLKSEGISPMEINDALNQSQIKEAVGNHNPTEGMVPSIMGTSEGEAQRAAGGSMPPQEEFYNPAPPQEEYDPEAYNPQPPMQSYPMETQQEEYYEEGSGEYSGYESTSDTMIEIAEQVFSEKIKRIERQIHEVIEFKTIYSTRIDDMNERLKRMEKYFDKMQMTIIDKVGSYGKELSSIQKEMDMIEDSFSKLSKK